MNEEREKLLDEIVAREWAMFEKTPNEGGPADCQQRPETFRLMRRMAHMAHDLPFLRSYLNDLRIAEMDGRNFMIEKYARMDNRIPPLQENPLLDEIAEREAAFLTEAAQKYPGLVRMDANGMFKRYLRCELETLSEESLNLYAAEIRKAMKDGRNPVRERHEWLLGKLGK